MKTAFAPEFIHSTRNVQWFNRQVTGKRLAIVTNAGNNISTPGRANTHIFTKTTFLTHQALDTWIAETGDQGETPEPVEIYAPFEKQMHDISFVAS